VIDRPQIAALVAAGGQTLADAGEPSMAVIRVETPYGDLYAHAADAFVTPYLQQDRLWEPGETAIIADRIAPGSVFIDIGAHIGYYTVLAARLTGYAGLVIAFEPEPGNFELLLANVALNRLPNVVCFPLAVSNVNGKKRLFLSEDNTGDHRLAPPAGSNRPDLDVRVVRLDEFTALPPTVDFVKIDVQGAEHLAIEGMCGLLKASAEACLSVEFWPHGIRAYGSDERRVLAYYRTLGFELALQDDDVPATKAVDDATILNLCEKKNGEKHVNLLLRPRRDYRVSLSPGVVPSSEASARCVAESS
jgi:FkbM family methyltransferase